MTSRASERNWEGNLQPFSEKRRNERSDRMKRYWRKNKTNGERRWTCSEFVTWHYITYNVIYFLYIYNALYIYYNDQTSNNTTMDMSIVLQCKIEYHLYYCIMITTTRSERWSTTQYAVSTITHYCVTFVGVTGSYCSILVILVYRDQHCD